MKLKDQKFIQLFTKSGQDFMENDCLKFSASLSYYTIFALPAFAIVLITSLGYFVGEQVVTEGLLKQINKMIGSQSADQIRTIITNSALSKTNIFETIISIITLVISASGMFSEIQSSINDIWKIKAKSSSAVKRLAIDQLFSFSMIVILGFILLISLLMDSMIDVLHNQLIATYGSDNFWLTNMADSLFSFVIITFLVGYIYRELPDAKIRLKDTLVGALFTAVLFIFGKYLIGLYLDNYSKISLYGAAGSILIILLWVYYSAIILYFGAVFTKNYAKLYGTPIAPTAYSEFKQADLE